jgi:arylsulfatase A-like enzyme
MRVPFVLSWPGKLPTGRVYHPVISSLDLAPTFLRLAGAAETEFKGLEGVDLWSRLTGADTSAAHTELKWRFTISAALREGDWKLVRLPDRLPMLFNLSDDLSEQHDVALQNLDRTKAMLASAIGTSACRTPSRSKARSGSAGNSISTMPRFR